MTSNSVATPQSTPLVTKRSLGIAGLAVLGACAACCALPLLAAAGVGGGFLATMVGYIRPGADLWVAGAVGVGVLGVMGLRARRQSAATGEVPCAVDGGCGCVASAEIAPFISPDPSADEPIVCTADLRDKPSVQKQLDGYRAAFAHLRNTERFTGGFRWVFATRPGLRGELQALAEKEHSCCRFFKFDLREVGDALVWEVRADERAAAVLEEFAQLPARLSSSSRSLDVAGLKERIGAAGLVFAADRVASK